MNWLTFLRTEIELFHQSQFEITRIESEKFNRRLRNMTVELLTAFEKQDIHRILDSGLKRIDSARFEIIVFGQDGEEVPFYVWPDKNNDSANIPLHKEQMDNGNNFSCVLAPLFFNDEIMGYLKLEQGPVCIPLYIQLSQLLANTLKVLNLYKERAQYTQKLEREVAARTASLSEEVQHRKDAEEQAVEKEKKVRQILETMPVPVLICRLEDSHILYANPSFRLMVGPSWRKSHRRFSSLFKRPSEYEDLLKQIKRDKSLSGEELPLVLPDNKDYWISFSARPLIYEEEKAYIIGMTDRTQRKKLEDQILTISDRERNRIGQDLHDDICQRMAGISFLSAALEKQLNAASSEGAETAGQISLFINETITQTRKLAGSLYPVSLQQMGLDESLKDLLEYYKIHYSINCSYINNIKTMPDFSDQQKLYLYRIAQEALSNAARHSKGTLIELILERAGNTFNIRINDDGIGVKKGPSKGGMGMAILQNRANTLGAEIIYSERNGGGTSVLCRLEVDKK